MIPEITTDRLVLRPLRIEDAADMFTYSQDEAVARPGMWIPYGSFAECARHVENLVKSYETGLMWWAMEHRIDGKVIGRVELSEWNKRDARAELSYALKRAYWGQGLMSEATLIAAEYGWTEMKLHRLAATVLRNNEASKKILQKLGMVQEGTLRDYRRLYAEWVDVDVYAKVV